MTLKELKLKYSGQAIPDWELIKAGLKSAETPETETKRSPGRPKKSVVIDADSDPDSGTSA